MKPEVELYSDGSCPKNPGHGGWAYILRIKDTGVEKRASGGVHDTTNNRMEMQAVIEGLKTLPVTCAVTVYSDSQYITKGISEWLRSWKRRGWVTSQKTPVVNEDLWKEIDRLINFHEVKTIWVKGHAGHVENELCDQMALAESKKLIG